MSIFTQKHYEYLERELGKPNTEDTGYQVVERRLAMQLAMNTLCDIFERDNPRFKRGLFLDNIGLGGPTS